MMSNDLGGQMRGHVKDIGLNEAMPYVATNYPKLFQSHWVGQIRVIRYVLLSSCSLSSPPHTLFISYS
jgi:hypothetical protein